MTTVETFAIHPLELGRMENFIYVIHDYQSNQAAIVDPGWDVGKIVQFCDSYQMQITHVLLTHTHYDHVNNLNELLSHCHAEVHLSGAEAQFWSRSTEKFHLHHDNDVIKLGNTEIKMLLTPGHTPGSTCFHLGDFLITGDTLFVNGCGRCDLAGGNVEEMFYSLNRLRKECPPETIIYPGHNYGITPFSTMAEQIVHNPFLQFEELTDFIRYRMYGR